MTRQSHYHDGDTVRRRRIGGATALSLALLGPTACGPDAQGKFDDYVDEAAPKMDLGPPKEDMPPVREDMGAPTSSETGAPPAIDISGTSLLAISTTVQPDLPLQFLSTVTQRVEGDKTVLDIELQPLSLEVQKVTVPRMPVGTKLTFTGIELVDGKYTVDAGSTMVTGAANPITGSDITATLVLSATVVDADFVCGDVSGMVTEPLETTIDGSTFASVRLADPNVLPTDVTINCDRETRTDG